MLEHPFLEGAERHRPAWADELAGIVAKVKEREVNHNYDSEEYQSLENSNDAGEE